MARSSAAGTLLPGEYHDLPREVDRAYISGAFYPALTGACCLGERSLNDLVMKLKAYYTSSERYKEVNRKDSLDDWDRAISILIDWNVIDSEIAGHFAVLQRLRNPSVHYGDVANRAQNAKTAIENLNAIAGLLFGQGIKRLFMCEGEIYIKAEYEREPFTKEFLLPHCHEVGYEHGAESRAGETVLVDRGSYPNGSLSDDEFSERRRTWRRERAT